MTLASSGPMTMTAINTEFGYGLNLNAYRGQSYWTDSGTHSTFSAGAITMSSFYSKRIPKTASYNGTATSSTGTSTRTFSSVSIGTAATNRLVVVVIIGSDNTNLVVSSVTIGGITATVAIQDNEGGNSINPMTCIAYATVPTGTTASVVVALNGSPSVLVCGSYSLYNLVSTTPQDTDFDTNSSPISLTLTLPANSFSIIAMNRQSASGLTFTNCTEAYDNTDLGHAYYGWSNAATSRTYTVSPGSGDNVVGVAAVWY